MFPTINTSGKGGGSHIFARINPLRDSGAITQEEWEAFGGYEYTENSNAHKEYTKKEERTLFPTPTVRDCHSVGPSDMNRRSPKLDTVVTMQRTNTKMPTPTTRDWKGSGTIAALTRPLSPSLDAVVRFFPDDTENGKVILNGIKEKVKNGEITEDDLKAIFPTPSCTGMAGGTGACQKLQQLKDNGTITEEERKALQRGWNGGKLNPAWVEWLMGWPIGWTELKPLETVKSPLAPRQPS